MVPIGGMPILEILLRQLKHQGFQHITLAVGYLSEIIQAYFQDGSKWGICLDYSSEPEPLGTAGPLALIDGLTNTFIVMNADILTDLNFDDLLRYHRAKGGAATIGSLKRQVKIDLGVIVKDGDGRVQEYREKPTQSHLVSMGVYVFEPRVLDFIKTVGYLDFPNLVTALLQDRLPVYYYPFSGYWMDIGRHDDYGKAAVHSSKIF